MKNSVQLLDEKNQLKKQASEILERCKLEVRDLNEEENKEIASIRSKIEDINKEMRNLEISLGSENDNKLNNKKTMNKEFRLLSAINAIANNRELDEVSKAVFNEGTSEMRKAGLNYEGQIQIPTSEIRSAFTVANEGTDFVATDVW